MDSSSSCVKIRTLGTNPLLLVEIVEGERCSRSSYKCQLQKDRDRLGQLPDEILIWILCSLSVDEAARTSVLSRRWEKLWRKTILVTPRLEFYCMKKLKYVLRYPSKTSVSEAYEYVDLVDEVTKLHPLPTLEEFTVGFPFNSMNSDDIDRWVEFAAEKEVKKLKFDFGIKIHHTDQSYEGFLASQGTGRRLNQLRDLYLRGVNVDPKVMQCLFSTSPFLQRLCVIDSHRLFMLEVAAPNLNYLEIRNCDNLQLLNISAPNLNKLKLFLGDSLLGIDNAFLGDSLLGIDNMSAPDLSHLSLGLHYMSIDRLRCIVDCFQELLGRLSQLKKTLSLRLSCEVFCEIAKTMDIWHQFPELSNVEYLKISVIDPWPWWYVVEGLQLSHGLLWPCALVKAAPVLHKLSIKLIHKEHKFTIRDMDFKWMDEDIPKKVKAEANFRHSHRYLKVVELFGFIGCRNDVEFVLHLLEIAVSLEKITIRVCPPSSLEDTDNLRDEENQFADKIQQCAQLLKKTRPYIDLLII